MNFAPYQDTNPEAERALSPPPPPLSPGPGRTKSPRPFSPPPPTNTSSNPPQTSNSYFPSRGYRDIESTAPQETTTTSEDNDEGGERGGFSITAFQTSLPIRMDFEAALAYLLLPPAGGVLLLVLEHKSDYVRFHAWQGSMLFTAVFVSFEVSLLLFVVLKLKGG
ncbi:MAG: hypothetical protein Q9160_009196 [Pyrenula sp. 1 TL-2023]